MHFTTERPERLQRSLELALNQEWPQLSATQVRLAKLRPTPIPISPAIAEMEWWAKFHTEDSQPKELLMPDIPLPQPLVPASYMAPKPYVSEPKIGRNDPRPCGSGK